MIRELAHLVEARTGIMVPPARRLVLQQYLARLNGHAGGLVERLAADREGSGPEWKQLLATLTVPETYLFRHEEHFRVLAEAAARRRAAGLGTRVLCAGCSTGEEVWSAAAVLAAAYGSGNGASVTGWDIDETRLATALRGAYRPWSYRRGLAGYDRFFDRRGDHCLVGRQLRPLVRLAKVNLRSVPIEGAHFDVVFFRNVAIYWRSETVREVLATLGGRIADDGMLFLGPSDPFPLDPARWVRNRGFKAPVFVRPGHAQAEEAPPVPPRPAPRGPRTRSRLRPARLRPSVPAARRRPVEPAATAAPAAPDAAQVDAAEAAYGRIRRLADGGEYAAAEAELAAYDGPPTPELRMLAGVVALNRSEAGAAVGCFREAAYLDPENPAIRRWYAVGLQAAGEPDQARRQADLANRLEATP